MNTQRTLQTERAVKAAREVAPISNWVKPSKKEITLPTPIRPTFERIGELEILLEAERQEKFILQNQLARAIARIDQLRDKLKAFMKDERS
jgi:hypothetical protein